MSEHVHDGAALWPLGLLLLLLELLDLLELGKLANVRLALLLACDEGVEVPHHGLALAHDVAPHAGKSVSRAVDGLSRAWVVLLVEECQGLLHDLIPLELGPGGDPQLLWARGILGVAAGRFLRCLLHARLDL
eukprot:CAMPEP_0185202416 /NCGR_PEP_ID=MMETSP1140-20130426/51071_1 /TAXON_ID=298111 /ORGANISM="Pavlova sp., Strain CCMP459" /LENGTH=132 /DNA_ID=CAMNT_0027769853 /DNA_START=482 /DNA_END=876 /DNA_ORIENTATION=-